MLILGKQLKMLRETHGISQADLANAIHVDLKAVKNWEGDLTNSYHKPRTAQLYLSQQDYQKSHPA